MYSTTQGQTKGATRAPSPPYFFFVTPRRLVQMLELAGTAVVIPATKLIDCQDLAHQMQFFNQRGCLARDVDDR